MGGASSVAASSGGGYSSQEAMSRATVPGTTGSYVSGMGWVPRAQAAPSVNSATYSALGNALSDAAKGFGGTLGSMSYPDYGSMPLPSTSIPDYATMGSTVASLFPNSLQGLGPLAGTSRGSQFQSAAIPRGPRSTGFQFSQISRAAPYTGA